MNLINFIVCDDIRLEVGNKHTIVGLYDDSIKFPVQAGESGKWPKRIRLGIFIRARFDSEGEKGQIKGFRLETFLNNKSKIIAKEKLNFEEQKEAKGVNLAAVFEQFILESAGLLNIKMVLLDEKDEEVSSLNCPFQINVAEIELKAGHPIIR